LEAVILMQTPAGSVAHGFQGDFETAVMQAIVDWAAH
jgi:hypothetical protein